MSQLKINFEEVPKVEMRLLYASLLEAVEEFFNNPANKKAFEEWMKKRTMVS